MQALYICSQFPYMVRFGACSSAGFLLLGFGILSSLLLKTCGKLHREMSALGNYLVAVLPEHLSTLQASKYLSLQHPCERGKCCNAIREVGGWGKGMLHLCWGGTLLHSMAPESPAAWLEHSTPSAQPVQWGFLPAKGKEPMCLILTLVYAWHVVSMNVWELCTDRMSTSLHVKWLAEDDTGNLKQSK